MLLQTVLGRSHQERVLGCAKLLGTMNRTVGHRSRGVLTPAGSFPRGRSAGKAKGGFTGMPADKLPYMSKALAENADAFGVYVPTHACVQ
jgi:hypothetical protein